MTGFLLLEDGTVFRGESVGAGGVTIGEAVFATAMTGYQETVTDPSYAGQIVCFTAPMVGNYGVVPERSESARPRVGGVVMREARGPAWTEWLAAHGVVALTGVDTRSFVLHVRRAGTMRAAIVSGNASVDELRSRLAAHPPMTGTALVAGVSTGRPYTFARGGAPRLAVVDYGCKRSILVCLAEAGAAVSVFPHSAEPAALAGFDGVVLSNGPGDPAPLRREIETVRQLLGRVPLLGICLGHQLLAQAVGLRTFKLPFGHRGANHPVLEHRTGRVLVTSQNHGFAVAGSDGDSVTHVSLYDGTVEGLELPEVRARSVQFHPEARPGPHDARELIRGWVDEVGGQALAAAA